MYTTADSAASLDLLLERLWREKGWDFRDYKRGTLGRRVERRLIATGAGTCEDYMRVLDWCPGEYQRLRDCLAVTVSGFFRNPCAFERLAEAVLPALIAEKGARRQRDIRIWSAACAGGEEPYSIAITLRESLGDAGLDFHVYATDFSRAALEQAAAGWYSADRVSGLPMPVLERYFTRQDGGYVVNRDVKEMVRFSYFDLVSTDSPPFERLDAVFCCNVLIYLQRRCQQRVVDMLCRSLAAPGYLVLGEAETPCGELGGSLECLDGKARIYTKR